MVPLLLTVVFLIWLVILFISQSIEESDSDIIHVKIPEEIKQLATSFKEKACIPVKYKSD
jgi:hypothetical protein